MLFISRERDGNVAHLGGRVIRPPGSVFAKPSIWGRGGEGAASLQGQGIGAITLGMTTLATAPAAREPETAKSTDAFYDPFTGVITLNIKTSRDELFTFDVPDPLGLLQTLHDAVQQRADDLACIPETL